MSAESPEKKQKTEEVEVKDDAAAPAAAPAPEKKEPPKELEEDAKKDSAPKVSKEVAFLTPDTTLNVLPSTAGNMLISLSEGGLAQLTAGARANVGFKTGRYMFETRVVEAHGDCFIRVGFATEGSLFVGEDSNSIGFANQGALVNNHKQTRGVGGFGRGDTLAVVLNLDEKSPNANTISLFKNGRRACQPQALPEDLQGKTLFPAVSFRGATLHVNFGAPGTALPFTCKTIEDVTSKDGSVKKYAAPAGGKYSVLFPVSLPDEGTFDWLDTFLKENPDYTEISDRAFTDWAVKSGIPSQGKKTCNDKPETGLRDIHNMKKLLMEVAALQPRNFVIMEVRGNLIKEEREKALAVFKNSVFKTVAEVVASDPPAAFKKLVHTTTLKTKQDALDRQHKLEHSKVHQAWKVKKNAKDAEKAQKKKKKETEKKLAALTKTREAAAKKKAFEEAEAKAAAEGTEPPAAPEEEPEEPAAVESEEEADEPMDPEPELTEGPQATLTAEEKAQKFVAHTTPDLREYDLAMSFTKFSFPEAGEFDTVKYSWAKEKDAATYLKTWILDRKLTTRVEDIAPSAEFKQKSKAWDSLQKQYADKQAQYKGVVAKKAADKAEKARKKAHAKAVAEKKAKFEADKKAKEEEEAAKAKEEGKEVEEKKEEEAKVEEKAAEPVEESEEEAEVELDFEGVDIYGVEDVLDVGGKTPLFRDFQFEDFALMTLRSELNLLVHSFAKDCKDPERNSIHVDHLAFYYEKYYHKALVFTFYGATNAVELVKLVNDTIVVAGNNCLESLIPDEFDSNPVFAKITEAARRERILQVDMGNESARLKFKRDAAQGNGQKRSWGEDGGGKSWGWEKGGGKAGGAEFSAITCFTCGGPHKARDCPQAQGGGKESWGKGQESWGKDAGKGKDSWGKDSWGKDAGKGKEQPAWGKDAGKGKVVQDTWGKDAGKGKESWGKDANKGKDSWGKDAGKGNDSWGKDAGKGKESWGKDAGKGKDSWGGKGGNDSWGKGKGKW